MALADAFDLDRTPALGKRAFHCPHCQVFAHQAWSLAYLEFGPGEHLTLSRAAALNFLSPKSCHDVLHSISVSKCQSCGKAAIWRGENLIWPRATAALPHPDMPAEIQQDFVEAGEIVHCSPRAAAALLRLCVEKLCNHLEAKGNNLFEKIGDLVARGLRPEIQRALDVVRVLGNECVHPGTIDLRDDQAVALSLFKLVNMIVEDLIARPKEIEGLTALLTDGQRAQIERRDREKQS
ncbi:MAG: DUF4145 domain-containing protein [Rhodospirillaceae bacterium]